MKYLKYFESRMDINYHNVDKSSINDFVDKILKVGKVNGKYILNGYKDELKDFVVAMNKWRRGDITKKELGRRWISFLKLLGISAPTIIHSFLTLSIILSFKKWGLERYLPDAFKDDYVKLKK